MEEEGRKRRGEKEKAEWGITRRREEEEEESIEEGLEVVWFSCSLGPDGLVFPSSFVQLAVAVGV